MPRPPEMKFHHETKKEVLENHGYKCADCGKQDEKTRRLQIHHQIAIWWAVETKSLAAEVISSIANAIPLCQPCHNLRHKKESRGYYAQLAPVILEKYLELTLDHSKDDWRHQLQQYNLSGDD